MASSKSTRGRRKLLSEFRRRILAVFSDTHGGHKYGLLNPETEVKSKDENGELFDEEVNLNAAQEFLWKLHSKHRKEVEKLAGNDEIVVLLNGDPTQGNRFPDDLLEHSPANQIRIAKANLDPWAQMKQVKKIRLTAGTPVHEFGESAATVTLGDLLAFDYKGLDVDTLHHGFGNIGGVLFDYAHHGPGDSARSWLTGNTARYYTRSLLESSHKKGWDLPHLVLRAHVHVVVEETITLWFGVNRHKTIFITTPSYMLLTDFARKITKSTDTITNGMVAVEIVDGRIVDTHWMLDMRDVRKVETL